MIQIFKGIFLIVRGSLKLLQRLARTITALTFIVGRLMALLSMLVLIGNILTWIHDRLKKPTRLGAVLFLLLAWQAHAAYAKEAEPPPAPPLMQFDCAALAASFIDTGNREAFHHARLEQERVWKALSADALKKPYTKLDQQTVSRGDILATLEHLDELLGSIQNERFLDRRIREDFTCFRMTGKTGKGDVLLTAYYHPIMRGSLTRTEEFPYPLYRKPDDLLKIDLGAFREQFKGVQIVGRVDEKSFVPYFDRTQIDGDERLKGRGLELAYVGSDLDRFFLQIQGSGTLILPNGSRFPVHYDAANGQKYVSIGPELANEEYLRRDELSMQNIRDLLEGDEELKKEFLFRNPSYVFFRKGEGDPKGSGNAALTAGRSFASDKKLFSAGIPAFLRFRRPYFDAANKISGWTSASAFMIDQDTGGAIKGPGRIDMYLGEGQQAEVTAGATAHYGEAVFLLRRSVE